jgi:hypothetical protein
MKANIFFFALAIALAGCAGGSQNPGNLQVKTTSAVISSMAGHRTYAYEASAPAPPGDAQWNGVQTSIAEVKQHIDADLQAKGYVLSPNPEMIVRISLGVRQVREEATGSLNVAGAPAGTDVQQDLAIDVFDYANGGHLFHGTASNPLHHAEPGENKLAKAVRLILQPVPPASS